jgi:hypothetical protein
MSTISERRADWAAWLGEVVCDTTDQLLRDHGLVQPPTVHMLMEGTTLPYQGFITSRPFRRGSDAELAIAALGLLPSVLKATTVVITWEHADLYTALNMPGNRGFPTALAVVDASLDAEEFGAPAPRHALRLYPFDLQVGPLNRDGVPTGIPRWYRPEHYPDGVLAEPIVRLLELWRAQRDHDLAATVAELRQWGYRIRFTDRA